VDTVFNVPVVRYRFELLAETALHFPRYAGSMWRGAFGQALKRTVCVTRQPECQGCLLERSCVYSQIFATPAGSAPLLEKGDAAPHPYIWHPHTTSGAHYQAGDRFSVSLTLIGSALAALPYLIHSVQVMGESGLGKVQGRFALLRVWQEVHLGLKDEAIIYAPGQQALYALPSTSPRIPEPPTGIRLEFHTPFRAKRDGCLMGVKQFAFRPLLMHLVRRCSLLQAQHAPDAVAFEADFYKKLRTAAESVPIEQLQLQWFEWSRYSNRQQRLVEMGGLLGSFELKGEAWRAFWPWLWWGQYLLVGKGAVMGMGEYQITPLDTP